MADTPLGDEVESRMRELAEFQVLDTGARRFVMKVLLHTATEADHEEFQARPDSQQIAQWMMTLPGFGHLTDEDEENENE